MRENLNPIPRMIAGMTLFLIILLGIITFIEKRAEPDQEPSPFAAAANLSSGFPGVTFVEKDAPSEEDGHFFRLTKDSKSETRYVYIPAEMKGPFRVLLYEGESLVLEGGGLSGVYASGDVLPDLIMDTEYSISVKDAEGQTRGPVPVYFKQTENVPSMFIVTESGNMDAVNNDKKHLTGEKAYYSVYETDGGQDAAGTCTIKGRGNSTWSQRKRPYNLNLDQEDSLLGMDSCKKLALVSNFWDSVQTRQYYAFEAAERLGLQFTPQTRFVNVYLNGRYHSICLLTQRINVNGGTVKITDLDAMNEQLNRLKEDPKPIVQDTDENGVEAFAYEFPREPSDLTGGYLIEFQNRYEQETSWFSTETRHMAFKSPEEPSVGEYQYISSYVREAEQALFGEDEQKVWEYFDMDSWARMYLIQDFFVQSDDEYYSFFFYKEAGDPLLYCGPVWDFDLSLGSTNSGDYYRTSARTLWLRDGRKRWLHRMDEFAGFRERVKQIYLEELEPIIRDILENEYDRMADLLETDTNLNYLRWNKNIDYRERVDGVRELMQTRVQFLHDFYTDPSDFHRLLFHFAWDDFSYYVKDGETMGFLPTEEYGEKQSSYQKGANGLIEGWKDTADGELLKPDTVIREDHEYDPVYASP